jgi:FdhE protein
MPFQPERERKQFSKKVRSIRERGAIPEALIDLVEQTAASQLQAREACDGNLAAPGSDKLTDPERHFQGAPLWARESFSWDEQAANRLFEELLAQAAERPETAEAAASLAKALDAGEFDPQEAFAAYVRGDIDFFVPWMEKLPSAPSLTTYLTVSALAPFLEHQAEQVYAHHDTERSWVHGHCPVCGQPPMMGRLLDKEGNRHLTCSFCHTEYRARRIQCAFCGEQDMENLSYFETPEEPGYRVYTCTTCKCYLKIADFREQDRPSHPLLNDLESLALDMAAAKQGYQRPTASAWGF